MKTAITIGAILLNLIGISQNNLADHIQYKVDLKENKQSLDGNQKLIEELIKKVRDGELNAYKSVFQPSIPLSLAEFNAVMSDTTDLMMEDDKGDPTIPIKAFNTIEKEDFKALSFIEEWSYNEKEHQFIKQVKSIGFITKRIDETGKFVGDYARFYIYLNE